VSHPRFELFEKEKRMALKAQERIGYVYRSQRCMAERTLWKLKPLKAGQAGGQPFERRESLKQGKSQEGQMTPKEEVRSVSRVSYLLVWRWCPVALRKKGWLVPANRTKTGR